MRYIRKFMKDVSGYTEVHLTLYFAGMIALAALIGVPLLDQASRNYAENQSLGVDSVVTGSVEKPEKQYKVRKSVLD